MRMCIVHATAGRCCLRLWSRWWGPPWRGSSWAGSSLTVTASSWVKCRPASQGSRSGLKNYLSVVWACVVIKKKTWLNTTSHCWLDTDMFFLFKCSFFCFTVYAVRYVTEYRYWINYTFYPRRVKQTYLLPTCFTFRLSYTVPYIWSDIQQTCPVYPAGYWKIADYSIWPDIFFSAFLEGLNKNLTGILLKISYF